MTGAPVVRPWQRRSASPAPTRPSFDHAAITAHVEMLHELAAAARNKLPADKKGVLVLTEFEENPHTERKDVPPIIERFSIGSVDAMVNSIMARDGKANTNLYIPWSVFRHDLPARKKGSEKDVVSVLAFVADLDNDTGKGGAALPVTPPYVIETSAGNAQSVFPLTRSLTPKKAKPLAVVFSDAVGCDHRSKDISGVWRIPGTLNWPTRNKLGRGRPAEPQPVKLLTAWTSKLINPLSLLKAARAFIPASKNTPAHVAQLLDRPCTGMISKRAEEKLSEQDLQAMAGGNRSDQFYAAVCAAVEDGMTFGDFEALAREYSNGCAEKYLKPNDRLRTEIERIWMPKAMELAAAVEKRQRFTLIRFNDILLSKTAAYLVKGLIPCVALTIVWGPPKCGKSFWAFDVSMHVALGEPYRGRRVQQGTVVYLALEGGHGFRARIEAWRRQHDVVDAPFYLITDRTDLVRDHMALIAAVRAQAAPDLPRLVVIDTLNRSLAGSESKDEDMAAYIRAADAIREALDCAVIVVHHCGVDASRPRGHTSLTGAADAQHRVERNSAGNILVTVEWLKDGAEGDIIVSALEPVELGVDDDGEPITSCVVVPVEGDDAAGVPNRKLSARQRLALDALTECVADRGQPPLAAIGLPASIKTVSVADWRTEVYRRGVLDRDAKSPREDFKRLRNSLQVRKLIGVMDDLVWRVEEESKGAEFAAQILSRVQN